jgi:predicted acyl esterase
MKTWLALAVAVALGLAGVPAQATADLGRAFAVPYSEGRYGVATTTVQTTVKAADGTSLFVETWLPAAAGGHTPPARVPVVAVATPYAFEGVPRPDRLATKRWTQLLVSHGYALANIHLRGTGESDGCWDPHGLQDADDISRAVDALTTASFSDGQIVLFGKSHDGGAALNAASRGDRHRLRGLRALVVASPITSYADVVMWPGIPDEGNQALMLEVDAESRHAGRSLAVGATGGTVAAETYADEFATHGNTDPATQAERAECDTREAQNIMATRGEMTPWLLERELALHTGDIDVPVLMSFGTREVQTRNIAGAFDSIRTPKAGVFSPSQHDYPDENSLDPALSRKDWVPMVFAWLDRWVHGTRNGVDAWPVAQVQGLDGQWRAEPGFPQTGGPRAQLALGPGLVLGATTPTGSTSFLDDIAGGNYLCAAEPTCLAFNTPALTAPLELVGGIRAELWVTTDQPDARLYSTLSVFDAEGTLLNESPSFRSLQYLEPKVRERFVQTSPKPAPVGTPLKVVLDYPAIDLVVPVGGRLELAFTRSYNQMGPAGQHATITLLHDCAHASTVTFRLPRARADWLDVVDGTQTTADLGKTAHPAGLRDGAGLASQPVCGRKAR